MISPFRINNSFMSENGKGMRGGDEDHAEQQGEEILSALASQLHDISALCLISL